MCGIVGVLRPHGIADAFAACRLVEDMRDRLVHRGPDDSGLWLDRDAGIALGFRRLSIVDLTPAGHQPMASACGRHVLVMNGEVYNWAAIRAEIDQIRGLHPWRGHCDTEVLVEAIAEWGVEGALRRVNGMFAFAVWDRRERALTLARDRVGKKPLYYGLAGGDLVFGSELKALWPHPEFDARLGVDALGDFLQLGYVPGRRSIFAAVAKLPAGHLLRVRPDDVLRRAPPEPVAYWSAREVALAGLDAQASGRAADPEELAAVLRDAVRLRMAADVPVGVFLSGGIDSSLVTALMAAEAPPEEVRSFSIGFTLKGWDEAGHARAVAEHLGTRHEAFYVGAAEFIAVIPELAGISDEPLADSSLIPVTLLSRMARRSVTVALSGDGGDELFAGYPRYAAASGLIARREATPAPLRAVAAGLLERFADPAAARWGSRRLHRRVRLLRQLLADGRAERFNEALMSQALDPEALLAAPAARRDLPLAGAAYELGRSTAIDRMTFADATSYLVDDILTKVDRASMSASLEVRCPLLDHRVLELSWRFPTEAKCRDGIGKLPLRELLYRRVPRAIVDRPKQGFDTPVEIWLRRELRDWAESLMSRSALAHHGLLDVEACRRIWEDFAERGRGWDRVIWNLLTFQSWYAATEAVRRRTAAMAA